MFINTSNYAIIPSHKKISNQGFKFELRKNGNDIKLALISNQPS